MRRAARAAVLASARRRPGLTEVDRLLVVAPHPDDETLGCAAALCGVADAGGQVRIVVVTDGAESHDHQLVSREELIARRAGEFAAAMARLGVPTEDCVHLAFPDGGLVGLRAEVTERLREICLEFRPEVILVTCGDEVHPDHAVCAEVALGLARSLPGGVEVLQYPIWLWSDWPFSRRFAPWRGVQQWLGVLVRRDTIAVDLGPYAERKRQALGAYTSQLGEEADAPALPEVVVRRALHGPELFFRSR